MTPFYYIKKLDSTTIPCPLDLKDFLCSAVLEISIDMAVSDGLQQNYW